VFRIDPSWKGRISLTMSDEGHQTRKDKTQLHWMLRRINADTNWYLTATPMVNSATDNGAEAQVARRRTTARLKADPYSVKLEQRVPANTRLKTKANFGKIEDNHAKEHVIEHQPYHIRRRPIRSASRQVVRPPGDRQGGSPRKVPKSLLAKRASQRQH
jgi:hypothetical protein